jgi:hypothetical protein
MAYFSNGSEGQILDEQCAHCPYGEDPCPVYLVQSNFNYDQCDVPKLKDAMNVLINEEGICQMRELIKSKETP